MSQAFRHNRPMGCVHPLLQPGPQNEIVSPHTTQIDLSKRFPLQTSSASNTLARKARIVEQANAQYPLIGPVVPEFEIVKVQEQSDEGQQIAASGS